MASQSNEALISDAGSTEPKRMPSGQVLSVSNLNVGIETEGGMKPAVSALALAISSGETFALVGESGSGKSMTALALLRLLPDVAEVSASRIRLGELELTRLPERDMRQIRGGEIGIIFQEPSTCLNPVLTVGKQLEETLRLHTRTRATSCVSGRFNGWTVSASPMRAGD